MSLRDLLSGAFANAKAANPAKASHRPTRMFSTFATFAVATPTNTRPESEREALEERAAILEFDAGLSRAAAERQAAILSVTE